MLKLLIANLVISMGLFAPVNGANDNVLENSCGTLGMDKDIPRIMVMEGSILTNDNGNIYIDTNDGNGWVIENSDSDYKVGNKYYITFDTKSTNNIYDDEIINLLPATV